MKRADQSKAVNFLQPSIRNCTSRESWRRHADGPLCGNSMLVRRGGRPEAVSMQVADVWSCGVMLYVMLAAAYPFGRPEDERMAPSARMHAMLQVRM